jgi:ACT domain-containing protein
MTAQRPDSTAKASPPASGRAIVTIIGADRIGIIAGITNVLAEANVNILDISQSVMREFFTMIMMVDLAPSRLPFEELSARLKGKGGELGVQVEIQREDIFKAMHRI